MHAHCQHDFANQPEAWNAIRRNALLGQDVAGPRLTVGFGDRRRVAEYDLAPSSLVPSSSYSKRALRLRELRDACQRLAEIKDEGCAAPSTAARDAAETFINKLSDASRDFKIAVSYGGEINFFFGDEIDFFHISFGDDGSLGYYTRTEQGEGFGDFDNVEQFPFLKLVTFVDRKK